MKHKVLLYQVWINKPAWDFPLSGGPSRGRKFASVYFYFRASNFILADVVLSKAFKEMYEVENYPLYNVEGKCSLHFPSSVFFTS